MTYRWGLSQNLAWSIHYIMQNHHTDPLWYANLLSHTLSNHIHWNSLTNEKYQELHERLEIYL
jgi:hypothetical protein